MMSNFRVFALFILAITIACSKQGGNGWLLDPVFSHQLVSFSEFYKARTKQDPVDTVDVLQIFKANKGQDSLFSIDEIKSRAWVYETTRREDITAFFRAARNEAAADYTRCPPDGTGVVYLILAFDRDLMRAGYLKYYPCVGDGLGFLTLYGSNSAYFSSELARLMTSIMGDELQKPARSFWGLGEISR